MLKQHRKSLSALHQTIDLTISVCVGAVCMHMQAPAESSWHTPEPFVWFLIVYAGTWTAVARWLRLHDSKRCSPIRTELWDLLKATTASTVVAATTANLFPHEHLGPTFLVSFYSLHTGVLALWRICLRNFLNLIRLRGYNFRRVLLVGRNPRAEEIIGNILANPQFGIKILGFVDAPQNDSCTLFCNQPVLGGLTEIESLLSRIVVDELIVTLPIKSFYDEVHGIIRTCEKTGVEVKIPSDLFRLSHSKSTITTYFGQRMIEFYTSPRMQVQLVIKRALDLALSLATLIVLSPILLAAAAAIKLNSEGPVFFVQKRVGYNGRTFNMYKFRTMLKNAAEMKGSIQHLNEMDGPVFKMQDDPRITSVGRYLRRTSIDEMPQLINVFMGDMSLVGPRPPVPEEVEKYRLDYRRRLSIKPGLTCTWQVSGRNKISFERWMEMDQEYIDEWSLWLDVKILTKTIPAVLLQRGAN
ncbi:MAG: sugar transferase [Deltaproteobacteria bacterium]|nr:sugar transferase [Deltaproteobacteria bacterium]